MSETHDARPADLGDRRSAAFEDAAPAAPQDQAAAEPVEEWPPREWRETTRSAGHRQALYVALGMVATFVVLVLVNIWGSHQG